jgi:hypothetical protein
MRELSDLARRCYEAVGSERTYTAAWDHVFEQLDFGPPPLQLVEAAETATSLPAADIFVG